MRIVEVLDYDNHWPKRFEMEAQKLKEVFADNVLAIYHIGSTAVQGLKAKPVIDILPVVNQITIVDEYIDEMKELGYEGKGENGIKWRRYFQKGHDYRTHHLHFYQKDNKEIMRHLAFRDYLRTHLLEAQKYGELKGALAAKYALDIDAYINGKDDFVKEVEKKA